MWHISWTGSSLTWHAHLRTKMTLAKTEQKVRQQNNPFQTPYEAPALSAAILLRSHTVSFLSLYWIFSWLFCLVSHRGGGKVAVGRPCPEAFSGAKAAVDTSSFWLSPKAMWYWPSNAHFQHVHAEQGIYSKYEVQLRASLTGVKIKNEMKWSFIAANLAVGSLFVSCC